MVNIKQQKEVSIPFTVTDARVFKDLFDVLEGVYGAKAQGYFQRYVKLWPQYQRLKNNGVNFRISSPRFGRRPLLIIDR